MKKELLKVLKRALETFKNLKLLEDGPVLGTKEAYEIINKILLYRILEDRGFIEKGSQRIFQTNYLFEPLGEVLYELQQENGIVSEISWTGSGIKAIQQIYEALKKELFCFENASDNLLGDVYEEFLEPKQRKSLGQFYTPPIIVEYIVEKALEDYDPVQNPYIRVADIACGSGHFLVKAYDHLYERFLSALPRLQKKFGKDSWQKEYLHSHLLEHCIYGMDCDGFAIHLTSINLLLKDLDDLPRTLNILQGDSLKSWDQESQEGLAKKKFFSPGFDVILGNPPYVGHKALDMAYKRWLLARYPAVFQDKSDLSYCFFERILENLKPKGKGMIITSRYFMESPTGKGLRKYLREQGTLLEIVDFYGAEIFKGLGVASAIYLFTPRTPEKKEKKPVQVRKFLAPDREISGEVSLKQLFQQPSFANFRISPSELGEKRWTLLSKEEKDRYRNIEIRSALTLGEVAKSFQGIITGCDKAFVLDKQEAIDQGIEKELLKTWVKSRHVQKFGMQANDQQLIYADLIKNNEVPLNALKHIGKYRRQLEKRRECQRGIRPWHHLQWGRSMEIFEQKKILFPYKSDTNRFALDDQKVFCSADVYGLVIKEEYKEEISLEYLLGLLNSKIYEEYFQSYGKKLGKGIYDYYPNSIMDLKIPRDPELQGQIEKEVGKILQEPQNPPSMDGIDQLLADFFQLTEKK